MTLPARFALLFAAQFAAIGAMMPFLPAVLQSKGLSAEQVSAVLAAGSAVRLLAAPAIGRGADRVGAPRRVLVLAAAVAGCTASGYALAPGGGGFAFAALLGVALLHSLFLAPVVPLSDALWNSAVPLSLSDSTTLPVCQELPGFCVLAENAA